MTKRFALMALCLMAALTVSADPITRSEAQKKAEQWLQNKSGSRRLAPVTNQKKLAPGCVGAKTKKAEATELYYVFNRGASEGYVIVAGDDKFDTFLGYTDSGEFDYQNIPDAMREWLDDYADYVDYIQRTPSASPSKAPVHPAIAPMVTTKWNQGDPYNQSCPDYFHQGRSVTGCVATAMAQILYYQRAKSPSETQADMPSYTLTDQNYGTMTVNGIPAGSFIDWDNMTDTYSSGSSAKSKKAVADLMLYCGVSVKMGYSNSSSGAYSSNVPDALNNYFGYGTAAKYAYHGNYSDEAWDALLYKELAEGRPFYLSGNDGEGGHAFVGDGYDGNQCYHINWGWGGSSDGYFLLTKMKPGSQGIGGSDGGYSGSQEAVIGCEPANYMEKAIPIANSSAKKLCTAAFDADGNGVLTYGEVAAVKSLGDTFKGQGFTSFPELYYFTGLTELDDHAFEGCIKLNNVKLPKGLKHIGANAFAECRALKTLQLPDELASIGEGAFQGCRNLTGLTLPEGLKSIEANTFEGCLAFTEVELPLGLTHIGSKAFADCSKLTSVTVKSVTPQQIKLDASVFEGTDLTAATLNVSQGTGDYFRQTAQWRDFGTINEQRTLARGQFDKLEVKKAYYLYNVGTGYYLTRGEAYNTQAVVANTASPMRFEFRSTSTEGVYSLYSEDTGNANHYLFRTSTDGRVGSGVKACFVDGASSKLTDRSAYWQVALVEGTDNVYTLQTPSNVSGYVATNFLGIQPSHDSNAASPTYGAYSDINYDDYALNCQWMLVPYEEGPTEVYGQSLQLKNLIALGESKRIDVSTEQEVYSNLNSTKEDLQKACRRLRKKLNFIHFEDETVRQICVAHYDMDLNDEVSISEAAAIAELGSWFSEQSAITAFPELVYFTHVQAIEGNGFKDNKKLTELTLPNSVVNIYYRAFLNCNKLESVHLSSNLEYIGDNAFYGCTSLKELYVPVADPALIDLGTGIFTNVKVANAVLYVPQGSKELYANASVWKNFGEIREMRAVKQPTFVPLAANTDVYVYNLGMRRSINHGEAYGTQAVVDKAGLVYQLRRSTTMAKDVYYLYSDQTGKENKVLFRTSEDSKVGKGVKTCFVDGTLSSAAYWHVVPVEGKENVYTFQVPAKDATYVEGEYLGTDYSHQTDVDYTTRGLYWDINYDSDPEACQWAFISVEEARAAQEFYDLTEQLRKLLVKADNKNLDVAAEHAVYDNFDSTEDEISNAILSVRTKLDYIVFIDNRAKTACVNTWDNDEDDELSKEEAAAVKSIGAALRGVTGLKSLEDLRHFTGLTEIPAEGFRSNSTMVSAILPAGITKVGEHAFTGCTNLKYLALLNDKQVVTAENAGLPMRNLTVFVPKNMVAAYEADEVWGEYTILEYTGVPTITGEPSSRQYGRANGKFTYAVTGAPINGEPTLTAETDAASPVGDYPIVLEAGTITSEGLVCVNGVLTIEPAPVNVTAKSYTINVGETLPEFAITYSSLRNREKIADVLLKEPVVECDAKDSNTAGVYEIRVSGAEAQNYEFNYISGKLSIVDPVGIRGVADDSADKDAIYDLGGRKVNAKTSVRKGIYIQGGKKVVR